MFGRKKKQTASTTTSASGKTRGMRMTEGLLPIFGPAQVGDSTAPVRPANDVERQRDAQLRTELTRVVGPDGHSYVVAVEVGADPARERGQAAAVDAAADADPEQDAAPKPHSPG